MLENLSERFSSNLPEVINREILGGLKNGEYYSDKYGIDENMLTMAEPIKSFSKGFLAEEVRETAESIGFSEIKIEYFWFLGQSFLTAQSKLDDVGVVEEFLTMLLPASSEFYKYLRFVFIK